MYGNGQDPNGVAEGGNRGRTGHAGHEQDRLQPQQYQQQQQSRRQSMQDQQVQGLRDVNDLSELTPVRNKRPVGRRADPMRPGKYISVSLPLFFDDLDQRMMILLGGGSRLGTMYADSGSHYSV